MTPDLDGFALRVQGASTRTTTACWRTFLRATAPVAGGRRRAAAPAPPAETLVDSPGVHFIRSDLQFILDQILIAERHAAGEDLLRHPAQLAPALGLRTVDGSYNNLVPGQSSSAPRTQLFPRLLDPVFRNDRTATVRSDGPGRRSSPTPTTRHSTSSTPTRASSPT